MVFQEANREKKRYGFSDYKADKKGTPNVFIGSTTKRKVLLIDLEVKMPEQRYI